MDNLRAKNITLTLTQQCNLACTYCYERNKSHRKMELSTARQIIDFELSHCDDADAIIFDLFGGEPFLEFDLIQKITEYICENKGEFPCTVFATTNGTLVHGAIQTWLKKYDDIFVCDLSIDGTREMHNTNRSNSYDDIDLDFFLEQYPGQEIKMTISQETLPFLAEGVIDLHRKGFLVSCNLAYQIDWSASKNEKILNQQLIKLIDFYLENPSITPCSMLDMDISPIGRGQKDFRRYCGSGLGMKAYDVDGEVYPCQFFMPLSIGTEKAIASRSLKLPGETISEENLDPKCRDCVVQPICPNCFGSNYASTGSIYARDDNLCRLNRIIIKARSYFRAKQLELGQLSGDKDTLQLLLRAIIKIQEKLVL